MAGSRRARERLAAAIVAVVAALVLVAAPDRAAATTAPGTLLSAHEYEALVVPGVPMAGTAWKIRYTSTTATGGPTVVTGTVFVPTHPADGAPLIGYAIGSQGMADRCAPSAQFAAGTEYEAGLVAQVLARGWVVALTDYPGLGTAGDHPYAIGRALAPAVFDAMRAARALPTARLDADGPTAVMGYSEGGGAAGWAAQLAQSYAPDLHVRAVAAGGVIADLPMLGRFLDGGPFSFLVPYTAMGLAVAFPTLHLERYLTATGRADVARLRDSCLEDASLDYPPFTQSSSVTTRDLFSVPAFARLLRQNSLGAVAPTMPVLMQQSPLDEVLPYSQAVALYHEWVDRGADVTFHTVPAPDHVTGGVLAAPYAIRWLAGRLAG